MPFFRTPYTLLFISLAVYGSATAQEKGFKLQGDSFTFNDGSLDFKGILLKPQGKGPFPAVLISHGMGSNAERFARSKTREFLNWGFVCIAPDYAHSNPQGDRKDFGASTENVRRAKKCLDILAAMPEVDARRLCAYGNSMGAFLTIGLAADDPRLAAAVITAGGINTVEGFPAPSQERARKIKTPFCILHGSKDATVPPERSKLLEDVLNANNVTCERHVYDGVGHELHNARSRDVYERMEKWFRLHAR